MKQRNMILVAVAVGCGLVAAFLTTQIGAKPAAVEQYEVPVAAKDIPVGTKLTKDEIDNYVAFKKFNKDALPVAFVGTKEELFEKRMKQTVRAGRTFDPQDLTDNVVINPPPGKDMMTIQANAEKGVAGFAGPGSRVNILASVRLRNSESAVTFPLLTDMLVLAIDSTSTYQNQGQAFTNLSTVSLAVDADEQLLLHAAVNRGADLRLVLRHPDKPSDVKALPRDEIRKILADDKATPELTKAITPPAPEKPKTETVKIPVPIVDLPAGEQLTADVIESKFKYFEIQAPAPTNIVVNLKEHQNKFLQKELGANQFMPRTYVGDKAPHAEVAPMPAPAPTTTVKEEPKKIEPKKPVVIEAPVYWDATVQTSSGVKKFRYEKLKSGEYKFLGELKEDGSVKPAPIPNQSTAPESKPTEEKKPDGTVF